VRLKRLFWQDELNPDSAARDGAMIRWLTNYEVSIKAELIAVVSDCRFNIGNGDHWPNTNELASLGFEDSHPTLLAA
jgi:hypothetical protein